MFSLRVLGGISLEADGGVVSGRAAQRRRLALLALLATAPGRTLSRDKLIGYLWPDSDTEQARHLLSVAVYELRRALGEAALVSRGDDVHLDAALVTSDVEAFEAALAADDPERAVALYAGPFLDGVYVSDAPEFERWSDEQRIRLEHRYREALETVAHRCAAAGDRLAAVEALRALAARDPYNARIAIALMNALGAAGDRAGALQHARVHETLVREEFGMEPDPGVVALQERLRDEPGNGEAPAQPEIAGEVAEEAPSSPEVAEISPPAAPAGAESLEHHEPSVDASPSAPPRASWWRGSWTPGRWAALLLVLITLAAVWTGRATAPADPSIAVLPFEDLSPGRTDEYFSHGLAEVVINALSKLDGLQVVARTSSFAFGGAGADIREVGRRLGVSTVLEGSVRRAGDELRITVRLVDVRNGFEIWSEEYDRPTGDVFRVQEEIARAVVSALRVRLVGEEEGPLVRSSTDDPEAFDLYLQGRSQWYARTGAGFQSAIEYFEAALEKDSTYALAWTGLADVYGLLSAYDYGVLPPHQAMPIARRAAERALRLDPTLAEAHAALGNIQHNYLWDWAEAEASFRRATELNPGYAPAHHWYSLLLVARGRPDEARAAIRRARELDPLSTVMSTALARHYYFTREFDRSIEEYLTALEMDESFVTGHLGIGLAYVETGAYGNALDHYRRALSLAGGDQPVVLALIAHAHARAGDREAAVRILESLETRADAEYIPPEYLALVHLGLGDRERVYHWLERAFENRSSPLAFAGVEPLLDPLRAEPRFQDLLRRIGI